MNFENLEVWQKSLTLSKVIYEVTKQFPEEEKFGITNQMRRSVISIISNIAEGSMRGSDKDFARFISIAMGSASELKAQAILPRELGFVKENIANDIIEETNSVARMLYGLKKRLKDD